MCLKELERGSLLDKHQEGSGTLKTGPGNHGQSDHLQPAQRQNLLCGLGSGSQNVVIASVPNTGHSLLLHGCPHFYTTVQPVCIKFLCSIRVRTHDRHHVKCREMSQFPNLQLCSSSISADL